MIEQSSAEQIAARLLADHKSGASFRPLGEAAQAGSSLDDAYRIQEAFQQLLVADGHGVIAGYKIALTSKAMQEMCGVNEPLAGAIFSSVVHRSPAKLGLSRFQHLGVEFEVAVELAADLPPADGPYNRDSVAFAVRSCRPAFELIEDRGADYKTIEAFSLIADNCWNGGVVLGQPVEDWRSLDLVNAPTRLRINGSEAGAGKVGDALGHPFEAVAWLANLLKARGKHLAKGMIVMTGSSITTKFPTSRDRLQFSIDGMGEVELELD